MAFPLVGARQFLIDRPVNGRVGDCYFRLKTYHISGIRDRHMDSKRLI